MKGMWRLKRFANTIGFSKVNKTLGAMRLLQNWQQLEQEVRREQSGASITNPVPLRFRNGLQICMTPGGYAGYRLLFPEIYLAKCYQPTPAFVPRAGWTVVDLGGNMGFFTLQAAHADKTVRVIAVEPVPVYAQVLRENVSRNRMDDRVEVIEAAVTGQAGSRIPITIWYTASGEPMVQEFIPQAAKRTDTITVPGITLVEVFEKGQIERCDLLKIDVEGAEYGIFEGTPISLWGRIHRVVMETHRAEGHNENDLIRILQNTGFQVRTKHRLLWAWK
jgi:FkbM family methyltransferase